VGDGPEKTDHFFRRQIWLGKLKIQGDASSSLDMPFYYSFYAALLEAPFGKSFPLRHVQVCG
jgi:hypothetical protein